MIITILIGFFAGIIGGMGIGGGAILIPLIIIFEGVSQKTAQSINLLFFIPTAISAVVVHIKNKNIYIRKLIPIMVFGIIGGIIGSLIALKLSSVILRTMFGTFLILLSIRELYFIKMPKNM